ncbi:uncharacterized protein LOC126555302 isoform X2 [Aphis gossypii]|uniref:uncharacterized protein LOC126555302 isoform X2 n=1 Tax=Aphis gossypii TaxID=80765 RepID=UPI002158BB79|nr:uncharacterized protein LOC126555302 isoform X2 [Aphis gossypii]
MEESELDKFIQLQFRKFEMLFSLKLGNSEGMEESELDKFIQRQLRNFAMLFSLMQGNSEGMEESETDEDRFEGGVGVKGAGHPHSFYSWAQLSQWFINPLSL